MKHYKNGIGDKNEEKINSLLEDIRQADTQEEALSILGDIQEHN